jgi:hypothetical protein
MEDGRETVADLVSAVRDSLRWAGAKNPNKAVLKRCLVAIPYLASVAAEQKARADSLQAYVDDRNSPTEQACHA